MGLRVRDNVKPELIGESTAFIRAQDVLNTWILQDRKARFDLILSISPSELKQVRGCKTLRDIWLKLEAYASKGPARKATLLKQLVQHKLTDDGDVREHLSKFFDNVDKLSAMDVEMNGEIKSPYDYATL